LVLALGLLISGFVQLNRDPPATPLALHEARAAGDEPRQQALENRLKKQRTARRVVITGLFAGCLLLVVLAYLLIAVE
jgi:type VI protein secretion system component VasF